MPEAIGTGVVELARGATIGRYLVLNMLGKGGMGEVYAAYDPELDRKVAIKVLHGTSSSGVDAGEARARILREAQALAQLSDPNVVAVYDVGTFGERVFLAMEFVDGSTLSFWQQSAIRSWKDIVDRYTAAGRGLAAAHKRGLVHRDFKPENAMVGRDGQVRVMDFGLARSEAPAVPASEGAETGQPGETARRVPSASGLQRVAVTPGHARSGAVAGGGAAPESSAPLRSSPLLGRSPSLHASPGGAPVTGAPGAGTDAAAVGTEPGGEAPRSSERALAIALSEAAADMEGATRDLTRAVAIEVSPAQSPTALASPLTQSGAMMGTPAYMAPEQFAGKVADAKSDQFAFCVALYEALYGERPFAGKNLPDLTRQVMAGRVRDAPAASRVPSWLRRVILRGLRVERDDRHASMEALLAALTADPSRRRRRYLASASVAGLIAALTVGLIHASQKQKMKCVGADARLAGVWELPGRGRAILSARKEGIRRAFLATGKSYATDAFVVVQSALDRYVGAWNDMHRDACEATHLRGEQSSEVLDLRMTCLQDRFNEVRALTSVFADANGEVVSKAAEAVQSLGSVDRCADIVALKAVLKPPESPAVRRAVADVRVSLAEVKALGVAGKVKSAAARIGPALDAARRTEYDPLIAEAYLSSAEVSDQSGDLAAAEGKYEDALWLAEACRHDEVAAQASAQLVYAVGYFLSRPVEGDRWARYASALLRRLGPGHDLLAGWLANNRSVSYEKRGQYQDAIAAGREAISKKERALGSDHFDVAFSRSNLANALWRAGQFDRALEESRHAVSVLSATLGPAHPQTAAALEVQSEIMNARGQHEEAAALAEKAIEVWSREWGPDHPAVAYGLTSLGNALLDLQRSSASVIKLQRALEIRLKNDPEPELLGETRFVLARALWASDQSKERALQLAIQAGNDFRENRAAPGKNRAADVEVWLKAHARKGPRISMR